MERINDREEKPEGERWLELIGRGDMVGTPVTLRSGHSIMAEKFVDVCGEDARIIFEGLDAGPVDGEEQYQEDLSLARDIFDGHFGSHIVEQ